MIELALAAALLLGWQRRWTGKAAAGMLVIYLTAMGSALGLAAVAGYAVPTLVGGALLISIVNVRTRTSTREDGSAVGRLARS